MLDFKSMKWDLQNTPISELFVKFNDLFQLYNEVFLLCGRPSEPHEGISKEQIVSLVVYTYHINSPLVQQEASIHKRRYKALTLLGIEVKEPLEKSPYLPYVVGDNTFLNRLALQFCKLEDNFKWIELVRKSEMSDDIFLTLKLEMAGSGNKSANDIMKIKLDIEAKAEGLQNRIQQLASEIFRNDSHLLNIAASHEILEKRKAIITPERFVSSKKAA